MKKIIAMLLSVVMLLAGSVTVLAAENPPTEGLVYELDSNSTDVISPRLSYLTSVFTDLTFTDTGKAICQGNCSIFKPYDGILTVTLQRSRVNTTDDSSWSNVFGASWSMAWNTMGTHMIQEVKNSVAAGYYYRVLTTATVYSNIGTMLETVVVKSLVYHH